MSSQDLSVTKHPQVRPSICVIGLGSIGLPTAALLANRSYQVHGVDVLAVEPNIVAFDEFEIINDAEAINEADIIVYLVAHKEFKGIRIFGKEVFDFCGVTIGRTGLLLLE